MVSNIETLNVASSAFAFKGYIPAKYSCEGDNVNPPISVHSIPEKTKSLAMIIEDPDAGETFDHWIVWNIRPTEIIRENFVPGVQGRNSFGRIEYGGPCPPNGVHRYFFKVFALDSMLKLKEGADKKELLDAMQGHILSAGELIGLYRKMDGENRKLDEVIPLAGSE